ncbi:hypothetical protein OsI_38729 [Oryza sativa Indica Group]|uniref:Glycosyltransferase n=1 Tax=Oryza sativa subsp. indica TaxID=39946 RepID=B8BMI2_ORYSI|nr:hypothetical protein OsI_38729 [Oryza sativa Indica Group]
MDADGSPPLRVVIFPWLAFGHLLPYMELAERMASRGHHVSFVSTPRNIARLPAPVASAVELVALPLPRVDGLADGAESTNDVPDDEQGLLMEAFDGLAAPFADFLAAACADDGGGGRRRRPDWVIADSFHHWASPAAARHGVPCVALLPSAAVMAACVEWEAEPFRAVAAGLGKPLVPLGLLPPDPVGAAPSAENKTTTPPTPSSAGWTPRASISVLYVALVSEVPLRVDQVHELALGLELAGARFLWALRKPRSSSAASAAAAILPPGFQERTASRGVVTMGWAPQIAILEHAAVGAFLTHCGQNSLVEGISAGNPLVMLPIAGDQGPNARLMEARKVGLQVARDGVDGSFDRHGVAAAVRAAIVDEETRKVFVANALKLREVVADEELHERYIDEFIHQLRLSSPTYQA